MLRLYGDYDGLQTFSQAFKKLVCVVCLHHMNYYLSQ